MIIKKYNQFVKTNEEVELAAEPVVKPQEPTTLPAEPITRPTPPSILPDYTESDMPAPAKAELPEEEEGGEYVGQKMMTDLSQKLGVDISEDGSINYEGKKINFYSETEKFHVDNKKFSTVEEVLSYLNTELMDTRLSDVDEDEYHKGDLPFESKSYRFLRKRN